MKPLKLNHVEESSDGLGVIKDMSLSMGKREIMSVISPPDSGESTLLRCATMLETMDSREVIYLGKRTAQTEDGEAVYALRKDLKEIQSQYDPVSQDFSLFPHYSIMKNATDVLIYMQKKDKVQVYEEARTLLRKMGLEDKEEAFPYQLSGDQCQRVAIARALALNPKILFFDEPTPTPNPKLTGKILRVIRSLTDLDIAMAIAVRETAFVRDILDRAMFMAGSVTVEEGTPGQVLASDNERARDFLGRYGALLN